MLIRLSIRSWNSGSCCANSAAVTLAGRVTVAMSAIGSSCFVEAPEVRRGIDDDVPDLGELEQGLERVLAAEAACLGAAERSARREQVEAVNPYPAGFDRSCGCVRARQTLGPDAGREAVLDAVDCRQHRVFVVPFADGRDGA